tara:strand:- start:582 stop:1103 length:522 start_codon:yes stop_codon:yes gene_type:complete
MSGKFDQLTEITPALRRYAYSLTGNQQRADDLVQDCLERALRKLRFKRASAPLRPWLFRMMRNIHIDTWRKGRREIDHLILDEMGQEPSEAERQSHSSELQKLMRLILNLPADQRDAIVLIGVEGFTYVEAAHILDVPEGTVMSRLSRARSKLRDFRSETGPVRPGSRLRAVQ